MLYTGGRHTVPDSLYGDKLPIMEAMHWTLEQYLDHPADLIDELRIKLNARANKPR